MKMSASYIELSNLVSSKTGKNVTFEYGGSHDVTLVKFMGIPCYVRILKVDDGEITLSHSILTPPVAGGFFQRGAQALAYSIIGNFVNNPAISVNGDNTITVNLNKLPQLNGALEKFRICGISFDESVASADVELLPGALS